MQVEVKKGDIVATKEILKAKNKNVKIVPTTDLSVLVENGESKKGLNYEMELRKLKLPIKKGEIIGVLKLKDGNKVISKANLTVKDDVKKASILQLYKRSLSKVF